MNNPTSSWRGKKILVTGAGGFIGSHLAETLAVRGATVRALVHYNALGTRGWLDSSKHAADMEIVAGDIADRDAVRSAAKDVDIIFHLAALIAIPYSYLAPLAYIKTNIEGTFNVLAAAREFAISRVIHTSTSEVYGTAKYVPIDEEHPLQGQSPYSASKIAADKLVEAFHLSFGVSAVTVRPFNTFGPRQSARAVIPTIVMQALAAPDQPIHIGSTSPRRELNFVLNTVDGFIKAAECDAAVGQTINLASQSEVSIGELIAMVSRILGRELRVQSDEKRVRPLGSEVERLLGSNAKAHALIGWKPATDIHEGLECTIAWLRENLSRYRPKEYTI